MKHGNNQILSDKAYIAIFAILLLLAVISHINKYMKGETHEKSFCNSNLFYTDFE